MDVKLIGYDSYIADFRTITTEPGEQLCDMSLSEQELKERMAERCLTGGSLEEQLTFTMEGESCRNRRPHFFYFCPRFLDGTNIVLAYRGCSY